MTEPPRRRFLSASWRNLILANYAVPDDQLAPLLPPGLDLDRYEGKAYCSLVGFQFQDTRVLGVPWPGFRHFPEWNLRFYVRYGQERGVVFVREFVPQWLVASVARLIYNEPYRAARMTESVTETPDALTAAYTVAWAGRVHTMRANGAKPAVTPGPGTAEHFFKEQSWGFGVTRRGRLLRYQVTHPAWAVYPVRDFHTDADWAALYGPAWAGMTGRTPDSVVLAAGSAIGVYPHGRA